MVKIKKIGSKIDLGCGENQKQGYIGIDWQDFGQDIVWDITKGVPLPDNSVEEIYTSHFVEHIAEGDINFLMWEILRICKKEAIINVSCPHSDTKEAYFLSHLTRWNENRVNGIVGGIAGLNTEKKFKLLELEKRDRDLYFILKIC